MFGLDNAGDTYACKVWVVPMLICMHELIAAVALILLTFFVPLCYLLPHTSVIVIYNTCRLLGRLKSYVSTAF